MEELIFIKQILYVPGIVIVEMKETGNSIYISFSLFIYIYIYM